MKKTIDYKPAASECRSLFMGIGRLAIIVLLALASTGAQAQGQAEIKFEETVHDFGTFTEDNALQSYTFTFTNIGDGPLVVHQAVASCGCTVAEYTQEPVLPGKTGTVKVSYNGKGRYPGKIDKSVTLRTNGKTEMLRLFIKGEMLPGKAEEKESK